MTALVLLFLVSPGDSDAAVTLAMRQAAIQVLGSATAIVIREAPDDLPDVAAIDHGSAIHALVVVRLTWSSREYLRARLRVHLATTSGWTSREFGFESRDAPAERGRALGYSVAAVVAGAAPANLSSATASRTTLATAAQDSASPSPQPARDPGATAVPPAAAGEGPRTAAGRFLFLDAAGATSNGFGGSGGQARLGWSMARLRFMLGGGARVGTVGAAQASSSHLYMTAGAAFDVISFWRIALAARGEAFLVRQSLSHFSADDVTQVKRSRWLPGFRPQLEVSLWPSRRSALIASAGWEVTGGATDVFVQGARVAVIPASRLVGELGLRVQF